MRKLILLLIGLLIIGVLLWQADGQQLLDSLASVRFDILLLVCILQIITVLAINLQWQQIGRLIKGRSSFWEILSINMTGTFVESITPAVKAGGEVAKIMLLRSKLGYTGGEAMALVSLQKAISMLSFLCLTILGLIWFYLSVLLPGIHGQILLASLGVLGVGLVALLLLMFFPHKLWSTIKKLPVKENHKEKILKGLSDYQRAIAKVGANRRFMRAQLAFSCFIWLLYGYKVFLLAVALGLELSLLPAAVVTYLSYMVGMLPLSPGGLGTFEGTMVFLLNPLGIAITAGMTLALVVRLVTFWFVFLLSGIFVLGENIVARLTKEASPSCHNS